jgi:hypothetical protein
MNIKALLAGMILIGLWALPLLASGPLSGSLSSEIAFGVQTDSLVFDALETRFEIDYAFGDLLATSTSEFFLLGFIWQGFGLSGTVGAFDIQGDLLFGPSTGDYLYTQWIVSLSLAGVDMGFYAAQLSDAVLGGPADGAAFRFAGDIGDLSLESVTQFGADIGGITIVHAATGLSKSYTTNPIVAGQGFTGELLSMSGLHFGCLEEITATLYLTCAHGFEFVSFALVGIDVGISWLTWDLAVTFDLQTKSLVAAPTLVFAENLCTTTYIDVLEAGTTVLGFNLYGFELNYAWDGVTLKELILFDQARYAITPPEYGSKIVAIVEAIGEGYDVYPSYHELLAIEVVVDGCCGGEIRFFLNTYFDKASPAIFDWAMTYAEVTFPIGANLFLGGTVQATYTGLDSLGFGIELTW